MLEQSLCLFGWVGGVRDKGYLSLNHYLAVFDINQWYQVSTGTHYILLLMCTDWIVHQVGAYT